MKSPTVSCTSKVPTRRVSFTSADSGSTGKSAADSGSSSVQDSSPSKEPTSNRKAIMPPPPHRVSNGDIGDGKPASQSHVSRLQPYTPPSPLAMAGRSGPAEESPLVVRSASLKRWTHANSHHHAPPDAHPACAEAPQTGAVGDAVSGNSDSADPYSGSTSAYSLSNFLTDKGEVLPNPLQSGRGGAPDEWSDTRTRRSAVPQTGNSLGDDAFPRWFQGYDRWLKPKDGTFAPLLVLVSFHGCACGCCGYCGCVCGHGMDESQAAGRTDADADAGANQAEAKVKATAKAEAEARAEAEAKARVKAESGSSAV